MLKSSRPWKTNGYNRYILKERSTLCKNFQHYSSSHVMLKVWLPNEDLLFGYDLSMYLMFLYGKSVLKILDNETRFSATTFHYSHGINYGQYVEAILFSFIKTWCKMYN